MKDDAAVAAAASVLGQHDAVNWKRDGRTVCRCAWTGMEHGWHLAEMLAAARLLTAPVHVEEVPR